LPARDLPTLIASVLAGLPLAGCPSTWNCHPPSEDFRLVDATVLRSDLAEVTGTEEEICERLCRQAYERERSWFAAEVEQCSHSLESGATAEGEATDPVGQVSCSGTGIEYYCEGRRPRGHVEQGGLGGDEEGRVLAALAHLEAAAVLAFEELELLLARHGAPEDLRARCRQAAADERVHTALLGALADRRGARVPAPRASGGSEDLLALALSNAVEGCVRESWAALEAAVIARQAADPELRAAFGRIARDEARHAQLSWDLDAWLRGRLADRWPEVEAARRVALEALPEQARAVARRSPAALGFPTEQQAGALAGELAARLAA
jgi:hypothetical protein